MCLKPQLAVWPCQLPSRRSIAILVSDAVAKDSAPRRDMVGLELCGVGVQPPVRRECVGLQQRVPGAAAHAVQQESAKEKALPIGTSRCRRLLVSTPLSARTRALVARWRCVAQLGVDLIYERW